ncbi:PadR family transcriptional regulator [Candidatus Bipolaricaulota bacterium]
MSLEYVILGFLEVGAKTGYDLKKRFDRSVSGFWPADQSRIYRTLAKLNENGCVTQEVIPQDSRPDRKVYHITEMGREALHEWLADCQQGGHPRSPFLVQLFFSGLLSDEEAIELLEAKAARVRSKLDSFPEKYRLSSDYEHDEPQRVDFFHYLTLDSSIHARFAYLEWIEGAIKRIRNREYEKGREGAITRWPPYNVPNAQGTEEDSETSES